MLSVKTETGWKEAHTLRVRVDGTWNPTQDVWVKKDGAWHSTCRYIMRATGRVHGTAPHIAWTTFIGRTSTLLRPDGSRYSGLLHISYQPTNTHRPLSVTHRDYRKSLRNLGPCFGSFSSGPAINALNSFKGFRWLEGPWLPLSGGVVADFPENYPGVFLPLPPVSSTALNAHLAQNINKTVTLYFR